MKVCFKDWSQSTFNSISRYLDDLLNIDNPYFAQMVSQIYPTDLLFIS